MLDINRAYPQQLIATPFVDDDVAVKTLFRAAGKMPDKRCLGQIHKQIKVVGECSKKGGVQVIV